MKKTLMGLAMAVAVAFPVSTFAATLTQPQVNAIIQLLNAFGVSSTTINEVQKDLTPNQDSPIVSTTTPITENTGTFNPIVQNTPSYGDVSISQVPPPVVTCNDTPTVTVTPFTLDKSNTPTEYPTTAIPLYDPTIEASVNQQVAVIDQTVSDLTDGSYSGNPGDYSGRVYTLEMQRLSLEAELQPRTVLMGISVTSSCSNNWLVDEAPIIGFPGSSNYPSDNYPAGTYSFVHSFNGEIIPSTVGTYQVTLTVHDGTTTRTVTESLTFVD